MRKLSIALAFLALSSIASAQSERTFKAFKFDLATGYAIPSGKGSKAGFIFALEPKYALNDNITLGLRMEAAVTARAAVNNDGTFKSGDVKASGSYLLTGDYYFNTNRFRPFAGVGAGLFRLAAVSVENNGEVGEIAEASKFGATPRVGFEFGHFRTAVEYNIVGKTHTIKNNYLGIKIGFFFGGGRK